MTKAKNKDIWKKEAQNYKRLLKKATIKCNILETENKRLNQIIYNLEEILNKNRTQYVCE